MTVIIEIGKKGIAGSLSIHADQKPSQELLAPLPYPEKLKKIEGLGSTEEAEVMAVQIMGVDLEHRILMGVFLSHVQEKELYGSGTYTEWLDSKMEMHPRQAEYYISISKFIMEANIPAEKLAAFQWSHYRALAPKIEPSELINWIDIASHATVLKIKTFFKHTESTDPQKFIEWISNGDNHSSIEGTSSDPKGGYLNLKFHADQNETVQAAMKKCKEISGTTHDSVAIDYICLEFLSNSTGKTKPVTIEKGCARILEKHDGDIKPALDEILNRIEFIFPEWKLQADQVGGNFKIDDDEPIRSENPAKINLEEIKFGPASKDETIVFGAAKPKGNNAGIEEWLKFMQVKGIERVICLLPDEELGDKISNNMLEMFMVQFGIENVLHAPIVDFNLAKPAALEKIYAFLDASDKAQEKVVIHCSAGLGRTGHVLAAWLVHGRGYKPADAIKEVVSMGRNPKESGGNLLGLLENCHPVQTEQDE